MNDPFFMQRCIDLAQKGLGYTYPNPLVGCVIVHNGKIIAEGWHKKAGQNHAEREAILKVDDTALLKDSTLYVNLEPCDHHGKTPPCTDLIVEMNIPKVVVGCLDENKKVHGKGIAKLQSGGCEVKIGVLDIACQKLNRRFFHFHQKKRPYIILKWAESADGFIAPKKSDEQYWLTHPLSKQRVHQWRSQEQAVMIGVQTALNDDPKLNTRLWAGNDPIPVVIDPNGRLSQTKEKRNLDLKNILTVPKINFKKHRGEWLTPNEISDQLYQSGIQSVIIEGGTKTLQHFIDTGLWDEARIFVSPKTLGGGLKGPVIRNHEKRPTHSIKEDRLITLYQD